MLKVNNIPSYEIQTSNRDLPSFRVLAYSAKKPNPITKKSVKIVTIIVGVFIALNPYHYIRPRHSPDENDRRPLYAAGFHKNWTSGRSGLGGSGFCVPGSAFNVESFNPEPLNLSTLNLWNYEP